MEQLIQALTAYTSTLEQQLAALETRVAQLEEQLQNCELAGKINQLEQQIAEQNAMIAALAVQATAQPTPQPEEPEIEIELVMEDDEDCEEQTELKQQEELEIIEEIEDTTKSEAAAEPIVEPVMELEDLVETTPIVEVPAEEPAPVMEQSAQRPTPTQTTLFGSAVGDIRQAISLGDRFLFQRELFAGNGELMQKTLDELNGLNSLNEAFEYMTDNFEWDKESTAVQLFENVLRRRFSI